jgi:hypothetical protein
MAGSSLFSDGTGLVINFFKVIFANWYFTHTFAVPNKKGLHANDTATCKKRQGYHPRQKQIQGAGRLSPTQGCLHPCVHNHAQEA